MYQDFLTKEFIGYHPDNCNVTVTSDTTVEFKCLSVVYVKATTCERMCAPAPKAVHQQKMTSAVMISARSQRRMVHGMQRWVWTQ